MQFDVYIKTHFKALLNDSSTRISRVATHQGSQSLHQGRRIQTSPNQLLLNSIYNCYFTNLIETDYSETLLSTTTLAEITF